MVMGGWFDNMDTISENTFVMDCSDKNKLKIKNYNKYILPCRGVFWFPQCV
jgi:hypothetical protein